MILKTENIVIVGGGSAGWMTASTLVCLFPEKNITLIESPDIPTVGVGESTLGYIRPWMHVLGIKEEDFMKHTDASYKLSIKFTDFYEKNYGSFHYPFGRVNLHQENNLGLNDWFLKKIFYPETPIEDYCRTFFPQMPLIEKNKFNENLYGEFGTFDITNDVAYHFDAVKFANWLKDYYAIPKGVNHIADTVKKINVNEDGIENLILDGGKIINADLYIDCTGFKSLLLGGALEEKFKSYSHLIPNNRAWATKVPYIDKQIELEPYTNCTAIDNGWVWNIPCWSRIGTGYVYSDKFISKEDALKEFKNHLKTKMTISNSDRITDDLEFKDIEMKNGIHERTWVKNVVAIGLAAGFIEPLESNGLLTVHEFLMKLVKLLDRKHISRYDQDIYNRAIADYMGNFSEFVAIHYALSVRRDTEYWKEISTRCFDEKIYKQDPIVLEGLGSFGVRKMYTQEYNQHSGTHCIATGLNYFPIDKSTVMQWEHYNKRNYKEEIDRLIPIWESLKSHQNMIADNSPSLYEYLTNKFYS